MVLSKSLFFMKKNFRVIIIILLVLTIVGILITSELTRREQPIAQPTALADEKIFEVDSITVGNYESFSSTIAKAENKNEITLTALNSGVIKDIEIEEGDQIKQNDKILEVDENYNGENSINIQIEIAQKQLQKAKDNQTTIKNLYKDKQNLAEETYDDYLALQELNKDKILTIEQQIEDSKNLRRDLNNLIDDYEDFEDEVEDYYEDQGQDFFAEQGVIQNRTAVNNLRSAYTQTNSSIQGLEDQLELLKYQTGANYPGTEIAEINKTVMLTQLKLEQDLAIIDVELASLNLELLNLQKDLLTMRSSVNGRVEKVYVKDGEVITPGDRVATISGKQNLILKAQITSDMVAKINEKAEAKVVIDSKNYSAKIDFISSTELENGFREMILVPKSALEKLLTPGSTVKVEFSLKVEPANKEEANLIYIPLDSVFRTNTYTYVLVAENGIAVQKQIQTGDIVGDQIRVISGLNEGEIVVNDRRIVPDQKIILKTS